MLKKIVRPLHTWIVKKYIPSDDQIELADALFDLRHGK